jgi:hypothetical protein
MKKAVSHYLARHAEREAALAGRVRGSYRAAVVMPACGEDAYAIDGVRAARGAIAIVVVNGREDHAPDTHAKNLALLKRVTAESESLETGGAWQSRVGEVDLLVIDRASEGRRLPAKQGVGLARKIGCDLALALWQRGKLDSRWIHWADADAQLPDDYLTSSQSAPPRATALSYRFVHVPCGEPAIDEAHARYECYLRYYRLGLTAARSPYAHHTIGSALAIDASAYAAVRGVPRLLAAEDFYTIDKAAKLGLVWTPPSRPIRIRARESLRVPFGTGRATHDMVAEARAGRAYHVDHPHGFRLLGAWIACIEGAVAAGDVDAGWSSIEALGDPDRRLLEGALERIGAITALRQALGDRSARDARRRAHDWFDGFRTLKLLHLLRDHGLGELPWREALRTAPFLPALDASAAPEAVREALCRVDDGERESMRAP